MNKVKLFVLLLAFIGFLSIGYYLLVTMTSSPTSRTTSALSPVDTKLYWRTEGNKIIDGYGQQIRIKGVNWSGAQSETFVPHGLWARNYKEIIQLIKSWGFDTIRLPFSNEMLHRNTKIRECQEGGVNSYR
jgi:aryl-phospho-beta-D-glucosidase BglC (GH1 family)